ncbi:NUDIX hydrolase, partial [Elusimicrobiota bacterium]
MEYFKNCPICKKKLSWKRIEDRKRLKCTGCGWINYLNPLPAVACLAVDKTGAVLMIKRAVGPQIGRWALPSGFIELEETPQEAALRELKEETGLEGKVENLIGVYRQVSNYYGAVLTIGYRIKITGGKLEPGD